MLVYWAALMHEAEFSDNFSILLLYVMMLFLFLFLYFSFSTLIMW